MKNSFIDLREIRSYLLLWFTQMISGLGSAMTSYALVIWSYTQEGSALQTALLMVCSYAPLCDLQHLCRSPQRPLEQEENHAGMRCAGGTQHIGSTASAEKRCVANLASVHHQYHFEPHEYGAAACFRGCDHGAAPERVLSESGWHEVSFQFPKFHPDTCHYNGNPGPVGDRYGHCH